MRRSRRIRTALKLGRVVLLTFAWGRSVGADVSGGQLGSEHNLHHEIPPSQAWPLGGAGGYLKEYGYWSLRTETIAGFSDDSKHCGSVGLACCPGFTRTTFGVSKSGLGCCSWKTSFCRSCRTQSLHFVFGYAPSACTKDSCPLCKAPDISSTDPLMTISMNLPRASGCCCAWPRGLAISMFKVKGVWLERSKMLGTVSNT